MVVEKDMYIPTFSTFPTFGLVLMFRGYEVGRFQSKSSKWSPVDFVDFRENGFGGMTARMFTHSPQVAKVVCPHGANFSWF